MKTSDWWLNAMLFSPAAAFLVGLVIEAVLKRRKRRKPVTDAWRNQ